MVLEDLINKSMSRIPVMVISCDKYSDLWAIQAQTFHKNWEMDRVEFILTSNKKKLVQNFNKTIATGEDKDWSTNLKIALDQIDEKHVLFWLDDCFFSAKVDLNLIKTYFDYCARNDIDCLRLRCNPKPSNWNKYGFGEIAQNAAYRATVFCCIWKVSSLKRLLRSGETAWDFEIHASRRAGPEMKIQCVRKDIFKFVHGVVKGKWILSSFYKLKNNNLKIEHGRPVQSFMEWGTFTFKQLKSFIFHIVPEGLREHLLRHM